MHFCLCAEWRWSGCRQGRIRDVYTCEKSAIKISSHLRLSSLVVAPQLQSTHLQLLASLLGLLLIPLLSIIFALLIVSLAVILVLLFCFLLFLWNLNLLDRRIRINTELL